MLKERVQIFSARRVVECAFGQLVSRFQLFQRIRTMSHKKVAKLIHAAVILHNFLGPIDENIDAYEDLGLRRRENTRTPAANRRARAIRDRFVEYFIR